MSPKCRQPIITSPTSTAVWQSIASPRTAQNRTVAGGACVGVELEDGEHLAADLCVDATGMTGPLMRQLAEDGHAAFETEDVRINIARIAARAHIGEHSSPEAEIRAIFTASMANRPPALSCSE